MRLFATIPACLAAFLLAAGPAWAQSGQDQAQKQPSGQTLMKRLTGNKNQISPFDSQGTAGKNNLGETQEQHDHYLHRNPDDQPITSSTVTQNHNDDD